MFISPQWGQLRQLRLISTQNILNGPLPGAGQLILYLELWSWARRACAPECIETLRSGHRWIITVLSTPYRRTCQQNSLGIKIKIVLALHRGYKSPILLLPFPSRSTKRQQKLLSWLRGRFVHIFSYEFCAFLEVHSHRFARPFLSRPSDPQN